MKLYNLNNKDEINNILLKDYETIKIKELSKIKCDICENNKNNTQNNEFDRCLKCKINLCLLCKSNHDKSHNIIQFEQNYSVSEKHNENCSKYCNDCKMIICTSCSNEHKSHNTKDYENIIPDMTKIKKQIK